MNPLVEDHLLVGAHLDDAGDRDHQLVGEVVDGKGELQPHLADRQRHRLLVLAHGVDDLDLGGAQPAGGMFGAGQIHLGGALAALRHREIDHAVLDAVGHHQRRRMVFGLRHAEHRAVLGQAGGGLQRELADLQRLVVDLERRHPPGIGGDAAGEAGDQRLGMAVGLLEMMRLQEQPLGPQNLAIPGHGGLGSGCPTSDNGLSI